MKEIKEMSEMILVIMFVVVAVVEFIILRQIGKEQISRNRKNLYERR